MTGTTMKTEQLPSPCRAAVHSVEAADTDPCMRPDNGSHTAEWCVIMQTAYAAYTDVVETQWPTRASLAAHAASSKSIRSRRARFDLNDELPALDSVTSHPRLHICDWKINISISISGGGGSSSISAIQVNARRSASQLVSSLYLMTYSPPRTLLHTDDRIMAPSTFLSTKYTS